MEVIVQLSERIVDYFSSVGMSLCEDVEGEELQDGQVNLRTLLVLSERRLEQPGEPCPAWLIRDATSISQISHGERNSESIDLNTQIGKHESRLNGVNYNKFGRTLSTGIGVRSESSRIRTGAQASNLYW